MKRIPWVVEFITDVTGKPICRIANPDDPSMWVETKGRVGGESSVLFERAWIEAMRLELERAADPDLVKEVENDLQRAVKEEQISQAIRRENAERALAESS
jgi:hypothetical protein